MKSKIPKSSIKLGKSGGSFRRKVLKEYRFTDEHDYRRLDLACGCLDRIDQFQEIIKIEGVMVEDRFQQTKEHPAVKGERDQKIVFARLIRELNLDIQPGKESRPPGLY
jgi:phage terminase small subunit